MNSFKHLNQFVKMNKRFKVLFLLFSFLFVFGFSQNPKFKNKKIYVSKENFKRKFEASDSLGNIIIGKDTLIEVLSHPDLKGIPVRYEYKDSTFLEEYKKVAFQLYHKDSADTKTMKYWKTPIKIYFSEGMDKKVIKNIMSFTKEIEGAVDSLNISRVKNINEANYFIYYDDDFQFSQKLEKYRKSDYSIYWNKKSQIYKGYMRIIRKRMFSNKLAQEKIKDLFFGSLGWFKRSHELGCNSYFSNCYSENKQMSEFDKQLLQYHYSYGICKGTTKLSFEAQHKRHKKSLKDGRTDIYIINN